MNTVGKLLAEYLERNSPVTAAFGPYYVSFPVVGTENEGRLQLTYHAPGQVRLQVGVHRIGTDRLYSNFLPPADAEDMHRTLREPGTHQLWLEQIGHLSDKVDAFWR